MELQVWRDIGYKYVMTVSGSEGTGRLLKWLRVKEINSYKINSKKVARIMDLFAFSILKRSLDEKSQFLEHPAPIKKLFCNTLHKERAI